MAVSFSWIEVLEHYWPLWLSRPSNEASSATWTTTASVLALSIIALLWSAARKSGAARAGAQKSTACPPELLKDNLAQGPLANSYALDHEISVPFDVKDVRVSKILVHPIKSCRGTSVQEVKYTPEGLEYDRKWCIIDANSHAIITAREVPKMVLITPQVEVDPASPHDGRLVISFPEDSGCETFSVPLNPPSELVADWPVIDDCTMFVKFQVQGLVVSTTLDSTAQWTRTPSEVLSDYFERPVHLVMKGPAARVCPPTLAFPELSETAKFQDGYPFLVASEESLGEVSRVVSAFAQDESPDRRIGGIDRDRWREGKVEIERFRPNIVFQGSGVPFAEDMWRRIRIRPSSEAVNPMTADEARTFTLVSKCTRCLLPNVDTTTGTRDAAVPYKVLLKFRANKDPARMSKPCFGCNAIVGGDGVVRVGDRVEVIEWASGIGV